MMRVYEQFLNVRNTEVSYPKLPSMILFALRFVHNLYVQVLRFEYLVH